MTVAVAHALMETWGRDDDAIRAALVEKMQFYGRCYPGRGYGGRFGQWLYAADPKPYHSFGNGSAMRVSPAGWLYRTMDETLHAARLTAEVTHNHPEGIKGAEAVAGAMFLARGGAEKADIASWVTGHCGYDLTTTLDEIRPAYRMDETCQGSVPQAVRAFLEGRDYENTLRLAVSIGGDSDTIACIAGGIAEAYYGMPESMQAQAIGCLDGRLGGVVQAFREFYQAHSGRPLESGEGGTSTCVC
jgi:ADP-ribosylglycohydrolase